MFNLQLHIRNFNLDPSGPVYISTSVPLSVLKLFYFVLHRILILQSNKVKERQLLNSKISVAMDGREHTGRLLPKHENSIL